jgi:hypothetical protein
MPWPNRPLLALIEVAHARDYVAGTDLLWKWKWPENELECVKEESGHSAFDPDITARPVHRCLGRPR